MIIMESASFESFSSSGFHPWEYEVLKKAMLRNKVRKPVIRAFFVFMELLFNGLYKHQRGIYICLNAYIKRALNIRRISQNSNKTGDFPCHDFLTALAIALA